MDERFTRTPEEKAEHGAWWVGFSDGIDETPGSLSLRVPGLRKRYFWGYHDGFYERKSREQGPLAMSGSLVQAQDMGRLRRDTVLPRWSNYTR